MSEEVEIVVSDKYISRGGFGAAKKNVKDLDSDVKRVSKSAEGMNDEIANGFARKGGTGKISAEVDKLGDTVGKAGKKAGKAGGDGVGDGLASGLKESAGKISGLASGMFAVLPGLAATAGAGAAGLFAQGFATHFSKQDAQAQLKAQFNMSGPDAAAAGKTAGELYSKGVGESIGETSAAVGSVSKSFKDLSTVGGNSIAGITTGALNASKVFGQDFNAVVRSAAQLMKNHLEPNAESALDTIVAGFQSGMDVGGDFLDTIDEYSPFFHRLGMSAREGLGLVNQFLEAGARNADFAADAIKEFSLKAIDGTDTTIQGFKLIGLNAEEMAKKIAAGGPQAKEAFGQVISGLQNMKDPIAQNTAGVDLFGTKWEDTVRDILPSIDMTKTGFENTAGSVDKMNKALGETDSSKLEILGRKLEGAADKAAGLVLDLPKITGADLWYGEKKADPVVEENNALLEKRAGLTREATDAQHAFGASMDFANHQIAMGIGTTKDLSSANSGLFDTQQKLLAGNDKLTEATGNNQRANQSNLDAFLALSAAGYTVIDSLSNAATTMDDASLAATGATVKIDALGGAIVKIPGQKDIYVNADTLASDNRLSGLLNRLDRINSKTITLTVQELHVGSRASNEGWGVGGYDHGGITSTAATGGQRGGNVLMNERQSLLGGEHVRLPDGSTVMSPADSRSMENRWSGGGGGNGAIQFEVRSSGSPFDDFLAKAIREYVRVVGQGNVQTAFGRG